MSYKTTFSISDLRITFHNQCSKVLILFGRVIFFEKLHFFEKILLLAERIVPNRHVFDQ